ncbi:MAG: GNAT family N-acetyltransferase [Chloroflexi bacterium]|nr:GNAT family N-acetyltransferase [Chloroflexota bacterium]
MNVSVVHELPVENWACFILKHPHGNIFHTPEIFEVFNLAKGYKPELWAATINGQVVSLFTPVQISLMNGLFQLFTTRTVSFGSILFYPEVDNQEALEKLLHTYARKTTGITLFTELRNQNDTRKVQPILQECGFNFQDHLNYLINLDRTEDEIWKGFSKSIRKHIHTAQKKNLIIHEITDRLQIPIAYNLLKRAYHRIKIPLPTLNFFEAAFDVLVPKKMLKIFLAQADDSYISTRMVLIYKDRITDWYTGSDRSFAQYFPEEFIIWHILQWGKLHGYHLFDFGGAGLPGEQYGPRIFKEKFGGDLVNFGRSTYIHHPVLLTISRIGYAILRRLL